MVWEICNPSTGQSFILPKMKSKKWTGARSFFGYDPTEKQFKLLSMIVSTNMSSEHQVLTLATTGKLSVRIVECGIPHCPLPHGICIDGVLYYKASTDRSSVVDGIMCFDVRSETFRFFKVMEPFKRAVHPLATLVNYKGKLASVMSTESESHNYINKRCRRFVMYVLQDVEKQEWSKHMYQLGPLRDYGVARLFFAGVTVAGELVLSPMEPSYPFYVFYYSLERKSIRKVEIQGMGGFKRVYTFVNHVEDVKLMQTF
ncbi:F-box protein DOR [Raphanus sativus]|nr:F-box protein DOR [Raphanus sativus]